MANGSHAHGTFVVPALIEIESIAELDREVFGPVLHVLRYRRQELARLIEQINATGYGLTLGVHTRIDETVDEVLRAARAGNVYVNRNMVGAVVGVQPFGGEGLSGTGPKAGGPLYPYRLLSRRPDDVLVHAVGDGGRSTTQIDGNPLLAALESWALGQGRTGLSDACRRFGAQSRSGCSLTLAGPTGERNAYALRPRAAVLCVAADDGDRLTQLAAVLAAGSTAVWTADDRTRALHAALPAPLRRVVTLVTDVRSPRLPLAVALHHGNARSLLRLCGDMAAREGAIVTVWGFEPGDTRIALDALVVERSVSVNTAAAGGNASLMMIG